MPTSGARKDYSSSGADNPSLYFEALTSMSIIPFRFQYVFSWKLAATGYLWSAATFSRWGAKFWELTSLASLTLSFEVENAYGYTAVLSRLIEDENYRLNFGEATRVKISETHMGMNWQRSVENLYERASACPMNDILVPAMDEMHIEDLDMLTPYVHNVMSDGRTRTLQELHDARRGSCRSGTVSIIGGEQPKA